MSWGRTYVTSCADGPGSDRRVCVTTQVTAKRAKIWIVRCWSAVGTRAHTWVGATCWGVQTVETTMKSPPTGTRPHILPVRIIRGVTAVRDHGDGRWGGATLPLTAALHEAYDLA